MAVPPALLHLRDLEAGTIWLLAGCSLGLGLALALFLLQLHAVRNYIHDGRKRAALLWLAAVFPVIVGKPKPR